MAEYTIVINLKHFISMFLLLCTIRDAMHVAEREKKLRYDFSGLYGTGDLKPYLRKDLIKETFFSLLFFAFTYWWIYKDVGSQLLNVGFFMICAINFYVALKPRKLRGAGLLVFLHIIFAIVAYTKILIFTHAQSPELTWILAIEPFVLMYLNHRLDD